MHDEDIASLIRRRRRQILVHSCIYYRLNDNIVPDYQYDAWARELADLHVKYPEIASTVEFADEYADFIGESVTGFNLPIHNPDIVSIATRMLKYHKELMASTKR
jgi:NAD-dependent DNA ligase